MNHDDRPNNYDGVVVLLGIIKMVESVEKREGGGIDPAKVLIE